jgi:hypothetical protein
MGCKSETKILKPKFFISKLYRTYKCFSYIPNPSNPSSYIRVASYVANQKLV